MPGSWEHCEVCLGMTVALGASCTAQNWTLRAGPCLTKVSLLCMCMTSHTDAVSLCQCCSKLSETMLLAPGHGAVHINLLGNQKKDGGLGGIKWLSALWLPCMAARQKMVHSQWSQLRRVSYRLLLQQPVSRAAPGLEGYMPVKSTQSLARLRDLMQSLALWLRLPSELTCLWVCHLLAGG